MIRRTLVHTLIAGLAGVAIPTSVVFLMRDRGGTQPIAGAVPASPAGGENRFAEELHPASERLRHRLGQIMGLGRLGREWRQFSASIAVSDIPPALKILDEMAPRDLKERMRCDLLREWGAIAPINAIEWSDRLIRGPSHGAALLAIMQGWAESNVSDAAADRQPTSNSHRRMPQPIQAGHPVLLRCHQPERHASRVMPIV